MSRAVDTPAYRGYNVFRGKWRIGVSDENKKTIIYNSCVGKRLARLGKQGKTYIVYQGKQIPLTQRITIGRGRDNSITLDDTLVSRHHAVIQKIKKDYFAKDLDTTNGTFVNGKRISAGKYQRLRPMDTILIGRSELSLWYC